MRHHRFIRLLTTSCLTALALVSVASANPVDGTVSAGSASIASSGSTLTVTQSSDKAVIDWRGFDIGAGETTKFVQPGSSSITLNRVNSSSASQINGVLTANGNIIIINQNGVVFGAGSRVDVNGLIATTANISNDKFMSSTGTLTFDQAGSNPTAAIVNKGTITAAQAGLVGLVAPNVVNNGVITARLGHVQLASGDTATVDLYGDGLIEVAASSALNAQLVKNTGMISADGGTIALTAAAGRQMVNSLITNSGTISAQTVSSTHGTITIANATSGGKIKNRGTMTARGNGAGTTGGTVAVLADTVIINATGAIDVSGMNGGGTILIGGDIHGTGAQTAHYTTVAQGATLTADAIQQGNGGKVIVWADETTTFAGNISAQGGALGGNGGFVETSGKGTLVATGNVNLLANEAIGGKVGTWLLDPANITIYGRSSGQTTDNTSTFLTSYLESQSTTANISLVADTNLTLDFGGSDTLTLATNRNLSLTATNGNITSASSGAIVTQGTGTISLTAGGTIDLGTNALILTSGGNVTTGSVGNTTLGAITTAAGKTVSVTVTGAGNSITTNGAIAVGTGGNITLTADDMILGGSLSGTGTVTLQQYTINRDVCINVTNGGICGGSNNLNLSTTELGSLTDGWSNIYIGRTDGSGVFEINSIGFTDPVTFRNNSLTQQDSNIDGTDNASITFAVGSSGWLNIYGSRTTAQGQNITVNVPYITLFTDNYSFASNNGNITINTTNGALAYANSVSRNGAVNFNAGTGTITTSRIGGGSSGYGYDVTMNGSAFSFTAALGSLIDGALGNVTLTSTNGMTLPAISLLGGKTLSATVSGAGNAITTTGTIAAGAGGNITLTADSMILGGTLSGTGILTLQPYATNRAVYVTYGSGDTTFLLSATELAYLADGWSNIAIGRADDTAAMYIGYHDTLTFSDPVTFLNGTSIQTGVGALTGTGNASFTFHAPTIYLYGEAVSTAGGSVTLNGTVTTQDASVTTNGGAVSIGNILATAGSTSTSLAVATDGGALTIGTLTQNTYYGALTGQLVSLNAGTGTLIFGGTADGHYNLTANAGALVFNGAWGSSTTIGAVSLTSANALVLPSITATSIFVQTTGAASDLTLNAGTVLTASGTGNALTLVAGRNFINNAGAGALSATNGRWLVYSTDPADTVGEETLANDFNRYSCAFSSIGTCAANATIGATIAVPGSGNGLIYSYTPMLTATANGIASIVYGDAAPSLTHYGYTLTGYLTGEGADLINGNINGTTNYTPGSDVGSYTISYSTGSLSSTLGYGFTYAANAAGFSVTPRTLTVGLTGIVDKIYNGTYDATLASNNYTLGNVYGSDNVIVANTNGSYTDVNVGTGKTVNVSGLTLGGSKAGDYILNTTAVSGTVGKIDQAALTIIANDTFRVQSQPDPVFTVSYSGLVAGDSPSVIHGLTVTSSATGGSPAGVYSLTPSGATSNNYTISYVAGTFRILVSDALPNTVVATTQNIGNITQMTLLNSFPTNDFDSYAPASGNKTTSLENAAKKMSTISLPSAQLYDKPNMVVFDSTLMRRYAIPSDQWQF